MLLLSATLGKQKEPQRYKRYGVDLGINSVFRFLSNITS